MWLSPTKNPSIKPSRSVDEINALGRRGEAIQADSASAQAIQDAVTQAARSSAGWIFWSITPGLRGGPLESMTLADIDALINVNIRGVVIAIRRKRWCICLTADASSTSAAVWRTAWRSRGSPSTR